MAYSGKGKITDVDTNQNPEAPIFLIQGDTDSEGNTTYYLIDNYPNGYENFTDATSPVASDLIDEEVDSENVTDDSYENPWYDPASSEAPYNQSVLNQLLNNTMSS